MLYDSECWVLKCQQEKKIRMTGMRMLRWMSRHTIKNKLWNDYFREKIRVVPIEEIITEGR